MKKVFQYKWLCMLLVISILSGTMTSCEKTSTKIETTTTDLSEAKTYLYSIMSSIYYWSSSIPSVNANSYDDIYKYFDALLVSNDRWSWMMDASEYNSMQTGAYTIYGGKFLQPYEYYGDYGIYMGLVYDNSPLSAQGVTRGWQLTKLNNTDVMTLINAKTFNSTLDTSPLTFTYKDLNGTEHTFTTSKAIVQTKSVPKTAIYTNSDYPSLSPTAKVGYMLYTSFTASLESEVTTAIQNFKSSGITDLIVDLRYNGGGDLSVCKDFASLLVPPAGDGKTFIQLKHNSKYTSYDSQSSSVYKFSRSSNSLDLNRIFFITGSGTASASESLINGLKPFTNIKQVGDTTYGKPNGMYVYTYPDNSAGTSALEYVFLPICFYCVNSEGGGYFDNGIVPDNYRYDDIYHDFGVKEDLISACLSYIATGSYPAKPSKSPYASATKALSGGERIIRPEDSAGYGLAIAKIK
ncbi:MAG: S41 family peptidase [Bacteroidales bacterium]|nr:S41 family peptidase [Bacteroidales bacterium]MDD4420787.1 S41 family peptidase [Bacteroidales bacterium]